MTTGPTHPTRRVPLVDLCRDGGTQVRESMNATTVQNYVDALEEGAEFPPVVAFYDGEVCWLADGFHRVIAHEKAGLVDVLAEVRDGTREDAVIFAAGANRKHGLPMSAGDRRQAVMAILKTKSGAGMSARDIADRVGVSHNTVIKIRESMSTGQTDQLPERTVGKDGKSRPARMAKPAAPPVEETPPPPPPAPARHPVLDEIDGAADLSALDRAFNRVALAGLSEDDSAAAGEAYRRRSSELRAQAAPAPAPAAPPPSTTPKAQAPLFAEAPAAVPPQAPSQPAPAATVTVDTAEWEALCQWRDSVTARAGVGDEASVGKAMRLVALANSPNEHEAASAAVKACRTIRERGLLIATSAQPSNVGAAGLDEWFENMRKQTRAFWSDLGRELLNVERPGVPS